MRIERRIHNDGPFLSSRPHKPNPLSHSSLQKEDIEDLLNHKNLPENKKDELESDESADDDEDDLSKNPVSWGLNRYDSSPLISLSLVPRLSDGLTFGTSVVKQTFGLGKSVIRGTIVSVKMLSVTKRYRQHCLERCISCSSSN